MSSGRLEAAHEDVLPGGCRSGLGFSAGFGAALRRGGAATRRRSGLVSLGFADWRPTLYAFLLWGVALGARQILEHGEPDSNAVRAARSLVHRGDGDFPDPVRALHRLHRLEPQRAGRPPFQRPRQSAHALGEFLFLERARQHGLLCGDRDRPIRDRLRACAPAQRRHSRSQVLSHRLPPALHAEPRSDRLDDRQVAHGKPLRASGEFRQMARLVEPRLLLRSLDRPDDHHRDGRVGVDPLHGDPAARWLAGVAASR